MCNIKTQQEHAIQTKVMLGRTLCNAGTEQYKSRMSYVFKFMCFIPIRCSMYSCYDRTNRVMFLEQMESRDTKRNSIPHVTLSGEVKNNNSTVRRPNSCLGQKPSSRKFVSEFASKVYIIMDHSKIM